jgi:hypothetical protein
MHYASTAWFYHFSRGNSTSLEMIKEMLRFLSSPSALVWIHIVASGGELRPLVVASKYLTEVVSRLQRLGMEESAAHRQALGVLSGWATDLVKIVGKFGYNLVQRPDSIYKLIPPFCPNGSVLYDQAEKKEPRPIQISGLSRSTWDDCLASLPLPQGLYTSSVQAVGNQIIILATGQKEGHIFAFNAATFIEDVHVIHPEHVFQISVNAAARRSISYRYKTTRVWDLLTGDCLKTVINSGRKSRPQVLLFSPEENMIILGSENRAVYHLDLIDTGSKWQLQEVLEELELEDYNANAPSCSAFSPDGPWLCMAIGVTQRLLGS